MSAFSKTEEYCDCGTLTQAADDPRLPIVFDAQLNEFHLVFNAEGGAGGHFVLWHCPLCGGKAPESKRHLLFAVISDQERARLRALISPLKTLADVVAAFGEPDEDWADGVTVMVPETGGNPPTEQAFRSLVYKNLSDVCEIRVTVYPDQAVGIGLSGKYIGSSIETQDNAQV